MNEHSFTCMDVQSVSWKKRYGSEPIKDICGSIVSVIWISLEFSPGKSGLKMKKDFTQNVRSLLSGFVHLQSLGPAAFS